MLCWNPDAFSLSHATWSTNLVITARNNWLLFAMTWSSCTHIAFSQCSHSFPNVPQTICFIILPGFVVIRAFLFGDVRVAHFPTLKWGPVSCCQTPSSFMWIWSWSITVLRNVHSQLNMRERIICCLKKIWNHIKSRRNAKTNQSWCATPTWPLLTFWCRFCQLCEKQSKFIVRRLWKDWAL